LVCVETVVPIDAQSVGGGTVRIIRQSMLARAAEQRVVAAVHPDCCGRGPARLRVWVCAGDRAPMCRMEEACSDDGARGARRRVPQQRVQAPKKGRAVLSAALAV